MLVASRAILVLVDVQTKLSRAMDDHPRLLANISRLVRGVNLLAVPVLVTEQNPAGLGPTLGEVASLLPALKPVTKMSFSCCETPAFRDSLAATGRRQVLLAGIETHVCVYQTAQDLIEQGFQVYVVADAVASRSPADKSIALQMVAQLGARLTSTEAALFEMLRVAEGAQFKDMLKIVK